MPISMSIPLKPQMGGQGVNATGRRDHNEFVGGDQTAAALRGDALALDYELKRSQHEGLYTSVASYRAALGDAEGHLARVMDATRSTKGMTSDEVEAERSEAKARVDRARKAYQGAIAQNREANTAQATALKTLDKCRRLLVANTGPLEAKPIKGDPVAELARIDGEIARVEKAVPDAESAIAAYMAKVDGWAKQARVRVNFGKDPDIHFPATFVAAEPTGDDFPNAPDVRPWLARFHRDELEADIRAAVAAKYEGIELTMSESEKRTKLRDLRAQRLNADYYRCQAIWDAYAEDPTRPLDFPADADPRAILGLSGPHIVLSGDRRD